MKKLALSVPFFLFFIFTSLFSHADVYYPHVAVTSLWDTEICVINAGVQTVTGTFKAYDNKGNAVSENIAVTLTSYARKQITVGDDFSDPSDIGYIIFKTASKNVTGYTKFYVDGQYRVAVPAIVDISTGDLYISHIASSNKWYTGVSIVNTTSTAKNLTIEFDDGTTKTVSLAAKEHKAFSIKSLFGNISQPSLNSAVIKSADGVVGLELFGTTSQLSGILLKNDTVKDMYFPHIASTTKWYTGIVAYNPSTSACTLTVRPYTAAGVALATKTVPLGGKSQYIGTIKSLGLPTESAWFQIESTKAITGFELFGTSDNKLLAGYTGVNINGKEGIFAKIEKDGGTGIAFVNITSNSASVDLTAYNDTGSVIATESLTLTPYQKMVDSPENIFTGNISSATYISYSSNRDLVGFQLNASSDNMMLDGLPGLFAGGSTGDATKYDGSYCGTYSGDTSGDWCFYISNGKIQGWAWDDYGDDYELTGNLSGDGSLAVGTADDLTTFSGTIDDKGNITGTWNWSDPFGVEADEDGTFSGKTGECPEGDIAIDDDIETVVDGTVEYLADDGGLGTLSLLFEALEEMGIAEVLEADSVMGLLVLLSGMELDCGALSVSMAGKTAVYTIAGGESCAFSSGTVTISNIQVEDDEISFKAAFQNVQSADCSINGTADIIASQSSSDQIEMSVELVNVTTCNGTIDGSLEAVIDSDTGELISGEADIEASYTVDSTEIDIETENLTYDETDGLSGDVYLTSEGTEYHCVLNDIVIDETCGVPTAGTLTIKAGGSSGLEQDVVFDFTGTTCADPTVTATINGRTVTYSLL